MFGKPEEIGLTIVEEIVVLLWLKKENLLTVQIAMDVDVFSYFRSSDFLFG